MIPSKVAAALNEQIQKEARLQFEKEKADEEKKKWTYLKLKWSEAESVLQL